MNRERELKKFGALIENVIGEGTEKIIYAHRDPEKVVKATRPEMEKSVSIQEIQDRYHLIKLLRLFLPANIPDIYMAGVGEHVSGSIEQKVTLDENHKRMNALFATQMETGQYQESDFDSYNERANDAKIVILKKKLDELGIKIDEDPRNFGFDTEGNPIYLDISAFEPWRIQSGQQPFFSEEILRKKLEEEKANALESVG